MLTLRKVFAYQLIIALVTLAISAFIAVQLPDRVPIHWGIDGKADGNGSRFSLVALNFGLTVLPPLLTILIPQLPSGKKRLSASDKPFLGIMLTISVFFSLLSLIIMMSASKPGIQPTSLIFALVGLMFAAMGRFLPGIKPNYYAGIRTPWTLASDQVWQETHQRAGVSFVVSGILMAIFSFAFPLASIGILLIGAFFPIFDSYRIFRAQNSSLK